MYAIIDIQGQQFKVEKNSKIFVHRLSEEEGVQVEFNKILLIENGDEISIGTPVVENAKISAKVLKHVKADKVKVFKKKKRKGFQKLNGHRQYFSQILIEDFLINGEKIIVETEEVIKEETTIDETVQNIETETIIEEKKEEITAEEQTQNIKTETEEEEKKEENNTKE